MYAIRSYYDKRPELPSKQAWSDQKSGALVSAAATIQPDWWRGFGDPYLDELIDRAIAGNIDIRILAARTGVAKAGIDQANAGAVITSYSIHYTKLYDVVAG